MVKKLALWVCPQIGCSKLSGKPGTCPSHPEKDFIRRVYVQEGIGGSGNFDFGNMGDILNNMFGSSHA